MCGSHWKSSREVKDVSLRLGSGTSGRASRPPNTLQAIGCMGRRSLVRGGARRSRDEMDHLDARRRSASDYADVYVVVRNACDIVVCPSMTVPRTLGTICTTGPYRRPS